MTDDKRHPDEKDLIKFLSRPDTTAEYIRRTAEWIKTDYPGSVKTILPTMRKLYADKIKAK